MKVARQWGALVLVAFVAAIAAAPAAADDVTEGFAGGPPPAWDLVNLSDPLGEGYWRQGDPDEVTFESQAGPDDSFAGVDYQSVDGLGTISDWMITEPIDGISNGDEWSFYTRTIDDSEYPDRLQFRLSTGDCDPGATENSVGSFTALLTNINPNLDVGGYPEDWAEYTGEITGVPTPVTGCFAWRYFVTGGGIDGDNSNLVAVDTFSLSDDDGAPDPPEITATDPGSPSSDSTPVVSGTGVEEDDDIELFATANCSGTPIGTGTGEDFEGDGITATVLLNQTTNLKATATGAMSGLTSDCSDAFPYTHDSIAPETTLDPLAISGSTATATFTSDAGATFECSLDLGPFQGCLSPRIYSGLTATGHQLDVRATDAAGNTETTPAHRDFTITAAPPGAGDTTPPDTRILKGPKRKTKKKRARFTLGSEPGATFACTLDGRSIPCSSSFSIKVKSGKHVLTATAIDAAGNKDASPAVSLWKVKKPKK
jgi:hypothetical protein